MCAEAILADLTRPENIVFPAPIFYALVAERML
jgi:hypothetical protein